MIFDLSPYLFEIGGFGLRYYSVMYLLGLLAVYLWLTKKASFSKELVLDYCFGGFLAVIIGGRLGYTFFYEPTWVINHPLQILKIWEGGMSFHGGLLGVVLWTFFFLRQKKIPFFQFTDQLVIPGLFATGLGRIGNFMNNELWGRVTDLPWCFHISGLSGCRHPSQLYQLLTDWLVCVFLIILAQKTKQPSIVTAAFLIGYAVSRISNEVFFREPSWMVAGLSSGTWLSIPLIIGGSVILYLNARKYNL